MERILLFIWPQETDFATFVYCYGWHFCRKCALSDLLTPKKTWPKLDSSYKAQLIFVTCGFTRRKLFCESG